MSEQDAIDYVQSCGEQDGPETYDQAAEIFAALYGRAPDADDGDQGEVWSLCCAAAADHDDELERILDECGADRCYAAGCDNPRQWVHLYCPGHLRTGHALPQRVPSRLERDPVWASKQTACGDHGTCEACSGSPDHDE